MIGEIATNGVESLGKRVPLGRVDNSYFLGECRVKLPGLKESLVVLAKIVGVELVELDGIDALAVLVDQLHHVFQEGVQALALEIETDQVTCVVSLRLEELLCVRP